MSSVISENETDFDEEPPFKYTKLGADVSSSTLKDSASVVRCCDEFIVSDDVIGG